MKIAILQLNSLSFDTAKTNYFFSILRSKGVDVVLIGEYVLNLFFKDLEKTPDVMIKEQSKRAYDVFKRLAKVYRVTIIAPLVIFDKEKKYKAIVKFSEHSTKVYKQQVLINLNHWNEDKFFDKADEKPMIFNLNSFKIGVMSGYEAHFDEFWRYFRDKNIDVLLIPTCSTFESQDRWEKLFTTIGFLNNCYVFRANRVGEYEDWHFYGDSLVVSPNGEILNRLGDKEEILIQDISKSVIKEARREWGFVKNRKQIKL